MNKKLKSLLAGCILCLMPLGVQAENENAGNDLTSLMESIAETITESSVTAKTGTIASTETSVTLTWPLEEKADFGYRIFVKAGERYIKVGETAPGENLFELKEIRGEELKPGTSYTVKVAALGRNGRRKKVISYRMIRTATMPETPEIIFAKRRKGKKAVISWEALPDISGYELQVRRGAAGEFKTVAYFGKNKTKTILKRLRQKKSYEIRIRAYKTVTGGRVYGEWSKIKSI